MHVFLLFLWILRCLEFLNQSIFFHVGCCFFFLFVCQSLLWSLLTVVFLSDWMRLITINTFVIMNFMRLLPSSWILLVFFFFFVFVFFPVLALCWFVHRKKNYSIFHLLLFQSTFPHPSFLSFLISSSYFTRLKMLYNTHLYHLYRIVSINFLIHTMTNWFVFVL